MKKNFFTLIFLTLSIYGFSQGPRIVEDLTNDETSAFNAGSEFIRTSFDDKVLFTLRDNDTGNLQLWVSNGHGSGTFSLYNFEETIEEFKDLINTPDSDIFFTIYDGDTSHIYQFSKMDMMLKKLYKGEGKYSDLTLLNESLYFFDALEDEYLQKLDPTNGSLTQIYEFGFFGIRGISTFNDEIVLIADHPVEDGRFLFLSDGTEGNARAVKLLNTGNAFSRNYYFTEVGDKLFFFFEANDKPYQLYVTDGTESGTEAIYDFEDYSFTDLQANRSIIVWNDKMYFRGNTPGNSSGGGFLFVSDGTASGTMKLDINNGANSNPINFTPFNGELYFRGETSSGIYDVYKTDGTQNGTVKAITARDLGGGLSFGGEHLTVHEGKLYFAAYRREVGYELWQSDGTTNGTTAFDDLVPGEDEFSPSNLVSTDEYLFFTGKTEETGRELFVLDFESTVSVNNIKSNDLDFFPNPAQSELNLVNSNFASDDEATYNIYSIDGKIIKKGQIENTKIDIQDLENGFWILSVTNNKKTLTTKFLKQ